MTLPKGLILILVCSLFFTVGSFAQNNGLDKVYQGYRLHLSGIRVSNQSPNTATLSFTAVNTGKNSIDTKEVVQKEKLILNFDPNSLGVPFLKNDIPLLTALFSRELQLEPGAFKQIDALVIKNPETAQEAPSFHVPQKQNKKGTTQTQTTEIDLPKDTVRAEKEEEINKEDIVLIAPEVDRRPIEELLDEKNSCPDLVFDTLVIIKQTDKTAWVEFTIKNIGKGPAVLYDLEKEDRTFGIRAYISGSTFISKGAVTIGGHAIKDGMGESKGILHPGETLVRTEQFDIRKMTRYMPVLILSLDAFLKLRECDRTNNTGYIIFE